MACDANPSAEGIAKYQAYLGQRYRTMRYAFEEFLRIGGKTIVELGTSRSYVSGGRPGCLVNDRKYWQPDNPEAWDWGAGLFTRMCAEQLRSYRPEIHTVDIAPAAMEICQTITADFRDLIHYHLASSEAFLEAFAGSVDLLYMDAGETGAGAEELHLREARLAVARQLFSPHALILIDDVNVPGSAASKGKYSIPFLCQNGFEIKLWDYQAVLQKTPVSAASLSHEIIVGM